MKTILVAAHELSARKQTKQGKLPERVKVAPGTQIDSKTKTLLGLDDDAIEHLQRTGAIVEVPVAVSTVEDDDETVAELRRELADMEKRATDAETRAEKAEDELKKLRPAA